MIYIATFAALVACYAAFKAHYRLDQFNFSSADVQEMARRINNQREAISGLQDRVDKLERKLKPRDF